MKQLIYGVNPITYPPRKLKSGKTSTATPANLGETAIWNEYGTSNAPPRPAFRMGLEKALIVRKKNIQSFLKNVTQQILQGRKAEIDRGLTVLLTGIGQSAKAETKEIISSGSTTPNAQSTIRRKGFNNPLYETGLLLDNIAYEITD